MQAIEFIAKAKNGTITIPEEYLTSLNNEFRVIILVEPQQPVSPKKRALSSLKVETKDLNFDRDEANER